MDTEEVPEEEVKGEVLTMLRQLMLWYWKKKVHQDFFKWFKVQTWGNKEDKKRVLEAGRVSIKYAMKASWWDWDGSSSIFFTR
jgi:inorganic pyrophosphatase